MNGECYFCHGIVSAAETGHICLRDHANHEIYMHEQCATGHDVVERDRSASEGVEIVCPECGETETH